MKKLLLRHVVVRCLSIDHGAISLGLLVDIFCSFLNTQNTYFTKQKFKSNNTTTQSSSEQTSIAISGTTSLWKMSLHLANISTIKAYPEILSAHQTRKTAIHQDKLIWKSYGELPKLANCSAETTAIPAFQPVHVTIHKDSPISQVLLQEIHK